MNDVLHLSREDLRAIDRLATEEFGIPSIVLMENAGRNAAELVLRVLAEKRERGSPANRVAIVCGAGNNGGDGAVVARHLANRDVVVELLATHGADALAGDAAIMRRAAERMGIVAHDVSTAKRLDAATAVLAGADVVVDALLGTGFAGTVRPLVARVIDRVNAVRAKSAGRQIVVALDLPSGLDADTGAPSNATVVADLTVTFAASKSGFRHPGAADYLGRVEVASIGAPRMLIERFRRN